MSKSIILDTNLTILLLVGLVKRDQISRHKRLQKFDDKDFDILQELVASSAGLIFTPNILTETSNLVRQIQDPLKTQLTSYLATNLIPASTELTLDSNTAVQRKEYSRLGLTDAVILHVSASTGNTVLLTDDFDLYVAAAQDGIDVINFTHERAKRLDFT